MHLLLAILSGALFAAGVWLILRRSLARLLLGLILLSNAANLIILTAGGLQPDAPAIIGDDAQVLDAATAPGATAILATFAEDGPEKCSGLPVQRYAPEDLAAEIERHLPGVFTPVESCRHLHVTPAGREQRFQFSVLRKAG